MLVDYSCFIKIYKKYWFIYITNKRASHWRKKLYNYVSILIKKCHQFYENKTYVYILYNSE